MKVFERLLQVKEQKGAGYLVLIDPDKQSPEQAVAMAKKSAEADVDALLIGGSLLFSHVFDNLITSIKAACPLPVIIFPGSTRQLSQHADALLYLSALACRNVNYIIGDQIIAAPVIKSMKLEPISTAYLFIESGNVTSAQFLSDTKPIPRDKPEIVIAHALAAEYFGMKMVYLEAGSGARQSVPEAMIAALNQYITIPIIAGGGIRTPDEARQKVEAGASFIVTGNVLEKDRDPGLIRSFAQAIHIRQ